MARDHSQASRGRKGKGSIIPKKILLFVEGRNTEPSYFELLKRSNYKLIPVVKPGSGIGSCVGFVEEADKKFGSLPKAIKEKYSQRWVVLDYNAIPISRTASGRPASWASRSLFQACASSTGFCFISSAMTAAPSP